MFQLADTIPPSSGCMQEYPKIKLWRFLLSPQDSVKKPEWVVLMRQKEFLPRWSPFCAQMKQWLLHGFPWIFASLPWIRPQNKHGFFDLPSTNKPEFLSCWLHLLPIYDHRMLFSNQHMRWTVQRSLRFSSFLSVLMCHWFNLTDCHRIASQIKRIDFYAEIFAVNFANCFPWF